jgi:DNA-directed RNA polymerase subunit beta
MSSFFLLPDLNSVQRESFRLLILSGLRSELVYWFPFTSRLNSYKFSVYSKYIQTQIPHKLKDNFNEPSSGRTYGAAFYVPIQFLSYDHRNKLVSKSTLRKSFFGLIPLMTGRGSFVVHGTPYVVVNQIARSPGIYFARKFFPKDKIIYIGTLIPERGSWLVFEIDKKGHFWIKIDKMRKVRFDVFLYALGFTTKQLRQVLRHPEFLTSQYDNDILWCQRRTLIEFHLAIRPDRRYVSLQMAKNFISSRFMSQKRYNLGKLGRLRLNKKLKRFTNCQKRILYPEDILATVDYLHNLQYGEGQFDDIDDLKNRRIRTSGELIQNQMNLGLSRFENLFDEEMEEKQEKEKVLKRVIQENSCFLLSNDQVQLPEKIYKVKSPVKKPTPKPKSTVE